MKKNKCIKCGLYYRKNELGEELELTHCLKCKIIESTLVILMIAARSEFNRDITITWNVMDKIGKKRKLSK